MFFYYSSSSTGPFSRLSVAVVFGAALFFGCSPPTSQSGSEPGPKANVSMQIVNRTSSDIPGDPENITVRFWDLNGETRAVQTFSMPPEGEAREVVASTPPGSLYVGVLGHSSTGIVSFGAMTEEPRSFETGTTTSVDLAQRVRTWDFEYKITGGQISLNRSVQIQTTEKGSSQEANEFIAGPVESDDFREFQDGRMFYDSQPFSNYSDAAFSATHRLQAVTDTSVVRKTLAEDFNSDSFLFENEALLESTYIRTYLPISEEWGENLDGVVRPHPSNSPLRLEDITAEVQVVFSKDK